MSLMARISGTWLARPWSFVRRDGNGDAAFRRVTVSDPSGLGLGGDVSGAIKWLDMPVAGGSVRRYFGEVTVGSLATNTITFPDAIGGVIEAGATVKGLPGASYAPSVSPMSNGIRIKNTTLAARTFYWFAVCTVGGAPAPTFAELIAAKNPLFWARLAESSGTTFADSGSLGMTGNASAGTIAGGASLTGDTGDHSGTFTNAASDFIQWGMPTAHLAGAFTYLALVNLTTIGGGGCVMAYGGGGPAMYADGSNKLALIQSGVALLVEGASTITEGDLHLLGISASAPVGGSRTVRVFLDGIEDGSATTANDITSPSGYFRTGGDGMALAPTNSITGLGDEFVVIDRELTGPEWAALAASLGL